MRLIALQKNIPSLYDKKSSNRFSRPLPILANPSLIHFQKIREVIINSESLPISIDIQQLDAHDLAVLITPSNIVVRRQDENVSLPFYPPVENWFKIDFGVELRKIEIKAKFNQNKLKKINFHPNILSWKNQHPSLKQPTTLLHLQHHLKSLQARRENAENKSQDQTRGGLVRGKFSERVNSYSYKQTLGTRRNHQNSVRIRTNHVDRNVEEGSNVKKAVSTTLNCNDYYEKRGRFEKRTSNTSNSVRSQQREVRLKLKKATQTPSYKPSFFDETSQFIPINKGKVRPRFYQQIPFTHQEIELKRKKFESQYIVNKEALQCHEIRNNESQVSEDIKKDQSSRITHLQDTFQRGMQQQRLINLQESGTLCQSVFQ